MFFFFIFASRSIDIFEKAFQNKIIIINATGSGNQVINGSRQDTKPEYAIYPWTKKYDWCSSYGDTFDDHPWITFSLENRRIKFNGFFIRVGCCVVDLCCCDEKIYYCANCCLYSWSLQISDDNITWKSIHNVTKDNSLRRCNERTYKLDKEYTTRYVRILQNEACPDDPPCISINKFELHGEIIGENENNDEFSSFPEDDDDVSIIGHISDKGKVFYR